MPIKLNGVIIGEKTYPNGERMFDNILNNISEHNDKAHVFCQYQGSADFETLFMLIGYINKNNIYNKILDIWYMPYLRMDRQVGSKDAMCLGFDYFINYAGTLSNWVIRTIDPHVKCTGHEIPLMPFINYVKNENNFDIICFPDDGAEKRYKYLFDGVHATAIKQRDIETGKIIKIEIDKTVDYSNKNILIIDDICSFGGTANGVAKQLKEAGTQKITAWFSHTELSILKGKIFEDRYIDKIYTTNSIADYYHDMVMVLTLENGKVIEL